MNKYIIKKMPSDEGSQPYPDFFQKTVGLSAFIDQKVSGDLSRLDELPIEERQILLLQRATHITGGIEDLFESELLLYAEKIIEYSRAIGSDRYASFLERAWKKLYGDWDYSKANRKYIDENMISFIKEDSRYRNWIKKVDRIEQNLAHEDLETRWGEFTISYFDENAVLASND